MKKIYYGSQFITKKDKISVAKSLDNELITGGKIVDKFEKKLKKYLCSKYVISCSSGTSALDLCLKALNVKKNDNIIIPAVNFVSIYSMAKQRGINIFLSDVDKTSGIMRPDLVKECIKKNKIKNLKAIIVMYLGGHPEYVKEFYNLKIKHNCLIIEDACHAFGSKYKLNNKHFKIGSCCHSDASVFSFHPVKTITTGEGGAISTNYKYISEKIKILRTHGIKRKKKKYWEYDIENLSNNYRLSDLNCSLGIEQLKKINFLLKKRLILANLYKKNLSDMKNLITIPTYSSKKSSWHLFIVSINFDKLKINKDQLISLLNKKGIYPQFHYIPIYKFSIYEYKRNNRDFKNSQIYYKNSLSLPLHAKLSKKDINYICKNLKKIILTKQSS